MQCPLTVTPPFIGLYIPPPSLPLLVSLPKSFVFLCHLLATVSSCVLGLSPVSPIVYSSILPGCFRSPLPLPVKEWVCGILLCPLHLGYSSSPCPERPRRGRTLPPRGVVPSRISGAVCSVSVLRVSSVLWSGLPPLYRGLCRWSVFGWWGASPGTRRVLRPPPGLPRFPRISLPGSLTLRVCVFSLVF